MNQKSDSTAEKITKKIIAGERITSEEGLFILKNFDLHILGFLANLVRMRKHPQRLVTFLIDRNINYTDTCVSRCLFCAFWKEKGYIIDRETLFKKIEEAIQLGATSILFQGGLNPELRIEWFEETFRSIKERYKDLHIHGLSAPEIVFLSKIEGI
ncbi:MAG: radical SAM protein, partial [candidate division WOR-3 bacterium]